MALPAPTGETAALITGASSGIGVEIARELARRGHNLVLVARRKQRLDELATELGGDVRVASLACDLTDPEALAALPGHVAELGLTVDVLVNNAGYGSAGKFIELDPESETRMVRLNCEAPVALAAHYAREMVAAGGGAILNVASSAGFQPIPGQATYAASKAFLLNFSDALHAELAGRGVAVTALCPGPVETEFAAVAGAEKLFSHAPGFTMVEATDVARQAVDGLANGRRNVVPGMATKVATLSGRLTPRSVLLPAMRRFYPA